MGQLPPWCAWVWFLIAAVGFPLGALAWILLVFWPYIKWSKRFMVESRLEAQREMDQLARVVREELRGLASTTAENVGKLADAQKIGIAVQVLCTIVPLFLRSVMNEGGKQGELWR